MRKPDTNAPKRMAEWRNRMKSEGWRTFNIWLSGEQAAALDTLLAESNDTSRNTLTAVLEAGIATMAHNAVTQSAPPSTADVIRAHARQLVAAGRDREHIRRELALLTGRDEISYPDIAELTGTEYKPPTLAELYEYGAYEFFERGFGYATLARWWTESGYPTRSGRGKWHAQTVEKFLNAPAPR